MDQMLNSGAGHFPPFIDPKDHRTDDEKLMDGCVGFIIWILSLIILLFIFSFFTSCASHKNVTSVSEEKKDSISAVMQDIVKVTITYQDSLRLALIDTTHTHVTVKELSEGDELVTEHIVEYTDVSGNKTVTTDRTIQRKTTDQKQTDSTERKGISADASSSHDATADSTASHNSTTSANHWEKGDSTNVEQQKSASNPVSWWDKVRQQAGTIVMSLLLIGVLFYLFKYCRGK